MAEMELKEKPQITIYPCPRCINGQILARNNWRCLQCGFELLINKEGVNEKRRIVFP